MDEVLELNAGKCMMWLGYKLDKAKLDNLMIKKANKK